MRPLTRSISGMLPPLWQKVALFNPVVYLISGFRWSFFGISDVNVGVSAAATKSLMLGSLILLTARFFVPYDIQHPFWMLCFLVLTALTFSLFGFIIGLWADNFQKLQVVPLMVVTPLTFLGGAFYAISMVATRLV